MELESSLPCLKELSTGPYLESDESIQNYPILFLSDSFLYYPPTHVYVFILVTFLLAFTPKSHMYSPMSATCSSDFILFDLIILIIFSEEYKL
jgi:hypothetical protein